MARTAQIHYQRITFSFPKNLVTDLKRKVKKGKISSYITEIIQEDLAKKNKSPKEIACELRTFSKHIKAKDPRSSLEILREIRYGQD